MSYRKLDVWQLARTLVVDVHEMTLRELPKIELYEEGSQIRRSMKSVKSNVVEGYGRRRSALSETLVKLGGQRHDAFGEVDDFLWQRPNRPNRQ